MKSDCCKWPEDYEPVKSGIPCYSGLYRCVKCNKIEEHREPAKLTPSQVKAIRWPEPKEIFEYVDKNEASEGDLCHWAVRYALQDLIEEEK